MTKKETLILRLNELRTQNNLPVYDPKKLRMSVEEIEGLIYHLETPSHSHKQPTPAEPMMKELLLKLNVLRGRAKEKPLKEWKKSRADLLGAIKDMERELVEEALIAAKRGQTKIADGANTKKSHTDLHKNPIVDDMKRMRKKQEREALRIARDTARKIALWAGYSAANVLAYLQAKNLTLPALSGEPLKADIKAFLETRDQVLPQRRGKAPGPQRLLAADLAARCGDAPESLQKWLKSGNYTTLKDLPKAWQAKYRAFIREKPVRAPSPRKRASGSVTPQHLAEEMKLDPRAVRVRLRKLESKIPKGWRVAEERWGFTAAHKADIIKLLGSK